MTPGSGSASETIPAFKAGLQPFHRLEQGLDSWIDLIFPLATTCLSFDNRQAAYSLLTLWIACRLALNCRSERLNWILLGLLLVNAGTIALDRDLQPSSPSDLLIIALAFAAGLNRSAQQWKRSLQLISLSALPLLALLIIHPPNAPDVLQLPGFNVNRLAFLTGILLISGWSMARAGAFTAMRLGGLSIVLACLAIAILTKSRAAVIAPILAIILSYIVESLLIRKPSAAKRRRAWLAMAATGLIALGSAYQWYGRGSLSHEDLTSDGMRLPTALCWANQAFQNPTAMAYGWGFNQRVRSRCDGDNIPILLQVSPPRPKGLPHAHNLYAQVLGETGLSGFLAVLAATLWAGKKLLSRPRTEIKIPSESLLCSYLAPLSTYLLLNTLFTSFHIYLMPSQILIGYSLAALAAPMLPGGSLQHAGIDAPTNPSLQSRVH
ncbi:MAG: O-antigen ligase family protein [Prochlorococcaceae cyanobacterium]